jgi:hypothetical protein
MIHTCYHVGGSEVLTMVVTKFYLLGTDVSWEHTAPSWGLKKKPSQPASFILQPGRWRWCDPLRHRWTFNELHGIISQKTELSIHGTSFQYGKCSNCGLPCCDNLSIVGGYRVNPEVKAAHCSRTIVSTTQCHNPEDHNLNINNGLIQQKT